MPTRFVPAAFAGLLSLAAFPAFAEFQTLEGTVGYRERIALPPAVLVNVQLVDISRADVPAIELGSVTVRPQGQVPITYQLTYDDAMVTDGLSFAVQATITLGDTTLFRTTSVYPALTNDAPEKVDVMVEKMPAPQAMSLSGTAWVGLSMPGIELISDRLPEITFGPDRQVSGTSGCNRFSGGYDRDGQSLTFLPLASTRMACAGPIDEQEGAVFKALGQVATYAVEDRELILKSASGDELMRFQTMY
ncbi:YbaY family lipoprotein [Shimia abyssi]|uniref:Putative lipoprotein n=1 Tax=Shimia abyssi TaxID=1662395 RepID=A0A2P8FEI6_9RHOB|nr:META domain-containing protein [Shimia abyssi]PSL20142.1 putative lipoprotein [Shimia abyssi]